MQKTKEQLHKYWIDPKDKNSTSSYVSGIDKSKFLHDFITSTTDIDELSSILEIGCNVGRNLDYLFNKGFHSLHGIEISTKAIDLMKVEYPKMAKHSNIVNKPVEDYMQDIKTNSIDMIYTMAVLEHIHTDSEWIFEDMVRISKQYIITIEDEVCTTWRHFPRNYKDIFEDLGMVQIYEVKCDDIKGLGNNFYGRVFIK